MSNVSLPLGPRGQKLNGFLKWGLLLAGAYAISHVILGIIAGIVGLAVAVVTYMFCVAMVPLVSLKISNFVMKRFIAEIRANPVEARTKVFMQKQEELKAGAQALEEFNRAVEQYSREIQELIRNYPEEAQKYKDHYAAMVKVLDLRYTGWSRAKMALEEYDKMTNKVRAIWKATLASDRMNKAAGIMATETAWNKIINDESIRVAEEGMANSFADLDHMLRMESMEDISSKPSVAALANNPSPSLLKKNADGSFALPSMAIPVARVEATA